MRIYRIQTNKTLFAFGDAIGDVPVLNTTLATYQESVCRSAKLSIIDMPKPIQNHQSSQGYFEFDESLLFSAAFLSEAVSVAKRSSQTKHIQFAIAPQQSLQRFSLPVANQQTQWLFPFYYRVPNATDTEVVELKGREFPINNPIPKQIVPTGSYNTHQNPVFAAEIISPFHLLQANVGLNLNRSNNLLKLLPKCLYERFANPHARLAMLGLKFTNRKGKNCHIHPSAVVEGCILGDNVTIGANAVVRLSIIGDHTFIGDAAVVNYSVIGNHNYVMTGNHLQFCLTYPSVFTIHGPYQFSVFGKNTAVFATINCDIRLDEKTIAIPTANGIVDSQQHLLGIAYGHDAKVGASNIIAAGRIVPNNAILNPPDFIRLKFDQPDA